MTTSTPSNVSLFNRAKHVIPGGVNSPVRAYNSVGGTPPFMQSATGAHITDIEGTTYIDYVMSWGPLLFGHGNPTIVQAAKQAIDNGSSFGAPTQNEVLLAEKIVELIPQVDQVRCVSSGTESVMTAIRIARGYTNRDKIIKFDGHYHGHADSVLVGAGSGVVTLGLPNSPGVTKGAAKDTIVVGWNDEEGLREAFATHGPDLAAVLYEPIACNIGCIPAQEGFHALIRKLASDHGALVIVDEVMTGFRLDLTGATGYYDLQPDLITFGKVIGGGYPLAAVGGKQQIMQHLAPAGPIYQAGTLSGNPVAVAAGLAQLSMLTREIFAQLTKTAATLTDGLADIFATQGIPAQVPRVGSMFALYFTDTPVQTTQQAKDADHTRFGEFFHHMLEHGITLPPSGYEAWFVSTMHNEAILDQTLEAARSFAPTSP